MKPTIKRRLTATMLLSSLALAPLATALTATAASAQGIGYGTGQGTVAPSRTVVLSIGRGELVNVPGAMADVFVANEAIADVQIKSQRQLYIFGKAGGVTTIYASNRAGDIIWSADVRIGNNIDSVDQMLTLAMPEATIAVATMGTNTVLLTGTVAAPEDAAEAERLVQAFVGDDMNVISRLKMNTPLQVNLQVRFAEVSRSWMRDIGANLATVDSTGGFQFGVSTGRGPFSQYSPGAPVGVGFTEAAEGGSLATGLGTGSTIAGLGRFLGLDLAAALDLAERDGLVTTLSQPNLTALSGESAEFLAGGEFPIPVSEGLGATSIQYQKYGVSLSYTPTVLANGRISIRVRPEVSELSAQGAVVLNGFSVPGLSTRRAETTIELGSGQSFMIAGLMSNNYQSNIDKTPGIGDVPILGNLFRSTAYRRGETELVIVVTPYLVEPVNGNDIALPTDAFRAPNEAQRLLGFRENDGVTGGSRPVPTARETGAPPPEIGRIDPQAALPAGAAERGNRLAEPAAPAVPGFSFK